MIEDLKELEKFFKICRKQGITDITFSGISVKFGDLPTKSANQNDSTDEVETEELTPEQMLFYAVDQR